MDKIKDLQEQLKRKEQECNKLYIQLKADEEYHKEEGNTLRKIIKNKEERNIELYKENNQLKEDEKSLLNVIDDLQKEKNKWVEKYNDLGQDFDQLKLQKEVNKYKQALDEIEEFCIVYSSNHDVYETVYKQILNIINKAKKGSNNG